MSARPEEVAEVTLLARCVSVAKIDDRTRVATLLAEGAGCVSVAFTDGAAGLSAIAIGETYSVRVCKIRYQFAEEEPEALYKVALVTPSAMPGPDALPAAVSLPEGAAGDPEVTPGGLGVPQRRPNGHGGEPSLVDMDAVRRIVAEEEARPRDGKERAA